MSDAIQSTTAIVIDTGVARADVDRFLAGQELKATKLYSTFKLDDVNTAVVEGRITRVVFSSYGAAMRGIWEGDVDFVRWQERGVAVDFVDSAPANAREQLGHMAREWTEWVSARRRRNAIAGAILSVFLLSAAFLIVAICGRGH